MSKIYTPETYSDSERRLACSRAEYSGLWFCESEIPVAQTPEEFLLKLLGTGFYDEQPKGKSLLIPTCIEGEKELPGSTSEGAFWIFWSVFNQAYDDCQKMIDSKVQNYLLPSDLTTFAKAVLNKSAKQIDQSLDWSKLVSYTQGLKGMEDVDLALLRPYLLEYIQNDGVADKYPRFNLLMQTACLGASFCIASNGMLKEQESENTVQINFINTMKQILRNSQNLRECIEVPSSLVEPDRVKKARVKSETKMNELKQTKVNVDRDGQSFYSSAWSLEEDRLVETVSKELAEDVAKKRFGINPSPSQVKRAKYRLAGELVLEAMIRNELANDIADIQGEVLMSNIQLLLLILQDEGEVASRLPLLIKLRNQLVGINPKIVDSKETQKVIAKIVAKADITALELFVSQVEDLIKVLDQIAQGEVSDAPTDKELVDFVLSIVLAGSIKLPKLKYPQNDTTQKVMLQIMEWWSSDSFAINLLEKNGRSELVQSVKEGKLNIAMFTCLFCQVARLANTNASERAKYITLNPLRSDFPTFLPYLIILQRALKEVDLKVDLIVGNTDDQDTFAVLPGFRNEVFSPEMIENARQRQAVVAKKMVKLGVTCGLNMSYKLYSDLATDEERQAYIIDAVENDLYITNPLIQARVAQASGMVKEQIRANGDFSKLMPLDRFGDIGKAFAYMYVMQGTDLAKIRSGGYFLVDTISPAANSEIYSLDKNGLKYPPINVFPKNRNIFSLLE